MDFIIKLSKSEEINTNIKYNNILMIVDKLTKYIYLVLYNELFKANQIAWIVLDRVIRHHGIPESIISDRDKIFINNF